MWDLSLEFKYRVVINEYVDKGYVRKLMFEEVVRKSRIIWYLLYYLVFNVNKFNKCCVVFDVVVRFNGVFFND